MRKLPTIFSISRRITQQITGMMSLAALNLAFAANLQHLSVATANYPTLGNPTSAIETPDGRYVFVSVTNVGGPNFTGPDAVAGARKDVVSGIQVFRVQHHKLVPSTFIPTGGRGANGLLLLSGGRTLVAGVGDDGVAFLDVRDVESGKATPVLASQGDKAGTFDVVATSDGRFVFTANEYGVIDGQRGNVGVIATGIDADGRVSSPKTIRQIPVGDVVPSVTISHDGQRLYVATELVPSSTNISIAGGGNPLLTKSDCVQKKGTPAKRNGYISVIDVGVATAATSNRDPIVARSAAGCSPVRLAEKADGASLFVTARGDNTVLEYKTALLTSNPEQAFQQAIPSGGEAPVGLRLFENDQFLAVADSNRFADAPGQLAIFRIDGKPELLKVVPAGLFPRNLSTADVVGSLLLTNYSSRSVTTISILPSSDVALTKKPPLVSIPIQH